MWNGPYGIPSDWRTFENVGMGGAANASDRLETGVPDQRLEDLWRFRIVEDRGKLTDDGADAIAGLTVPVRHVAW